MSYLGLGVEKQIGDYILNEAIVEGSNCQVFQATHIPTGEKVAIKVLNKIKLHAEPELRKKAERELSILKKMFHKNIIRLFEIMETAQRLYIVTEYCEGGDLYNYISTRGHLSERQSCKFFHEIIEALSYLHSQQITHRDIKPENFLLDTSGKSISLKLIDFGISNHYKGNLLETSCGTSAFAAPEMYVGGKYSALPCDIWSSGVVLYAMLFGYLPFGDENEINNIANIISGNYEIPEEASDDLRDLLTHIIEVEPNKRYNLEQIKSHKWYNSVKVDSIPGLNIDKYKIPVDERIVSVCEAYGFEKDKITESVSENYYDNNTSIYYVILNKFIRERYDSISDLFSQDYLDYLNDPKNLIDENSRKNQSDDDEKIGDIEEKEKEKKIRNKNKNKNENNRKKNIKEVIYEDKTNEDDNNNDRNNDEGKENFDDLYEDKSIDENNNNNNNDNEDLYEDKSNHEEDDNKDNIYENIYEDKNDNEGKQTKNINNNKENGKNDNNNFDHYNESIYKKEDKNENNNKENKNDNNNIEIKDEKNEEEKKENENIREKVRPKLERNNNALSFNFENSFYEDENSEDQNKIDEKHITEDNNTNKKENANESNLKNDKKIKNTNEVNDSTEDFQMNPISESDQNNNLRNSNNLSNLNYTTVQRNEGLSSSYSDVTPKDNNSDKANNIGKEKPKLKKEINSNANIVIKSQINTLNNLKEIINKNKFKNNAVGNHKNKYKNNKTDSKKNFEKKNIYKYNSNKLDNPKKTNKFTKRRKAKNHTIIHNRNPSASNRKPKNTIVYLDNDNNIKINYRNFSDEKNRNLKNKNITYNSQGMNKPNEIYRKKRPLQKLKNTSKTERKYIDENNSGNQCDNNIPKNSDEKNRVVKHRQFNNYSIDLNNINYKEKKYKDFKIKNNTNNNDRTISNYSSYVKTYQKNYTSLPQKTSNDKSECVARRLLSNYKDKSTSKKRHEKTISLYSNPGKTNYNFESPYIKKDDYHEMMLKSGGNKSFTYYSKNTNDKDKTKKLKQNSLKRNNPKLNYNSLLKNLNNNDYSSNNRSFLTSDRNRTISKSKSKSRKRTHNKSFDINLSKEEKKTILKNINKEWEKELFGFKIKNNYWPKAYKGPINIKSLLYSNKLEEIIREIITFLNKNEIRFKRDKSQFKFICHKNEKFFDMEIFSFDNKNIKINTLFYFSYITKTQYILGLKKYLDELNKILLQKFSLKNYISK